MQTTLSARAPSPAARWDPSDRQVVVWLCLIAVALGLVEAWISRNDMYSDGISYMDVGDAFVRGQWRDAVNGYWSPLYPALLGAAAFVLKPAATWQFATVHLVNFLVYLVALACFHWFLTGLIRHTETREGFHFDRRWWIAVGYTLFLWTSLRLITVSLVSPDMAVAASIYGACGALLRIETERAKARYFAILGLALSLGYLAKAPMLPMAVVFLTLGCFAAKRLRTALAGAGIAVIVFGVVAGPFVSALSIKEGHFTFGDSAKLNYVWYVNHIPRYHWQGEPAGSGKPAHSTQRVFDSPPVYAFDQPISGTYPIWKDPSYWFDGIQTHLDPKSLILQTAANGYIYYDVLFRSQPGFALTLAALVLLTGAGGLFARRLLHEWILLVPPVCALSMYAPIHVETRMIGAYIVMLWLGAFAAVALAPSRAVFSITAALVGVILVGIGASTLGQTAAHGTAFLLRGDNSSVPSYQVASALQRVGIGRGDSVAWIRPQPFDERQNYWWARIAGIRIESEIPVGQSDRFWGAPPAVKQQALQAIARTGARALVATTAPAGALADGWQSLGKTGYFIYPLNRSSLAVTSGTNP